jgi:hypothetical protein
MSSVARNRFRASIWHSGTEEKASSTPFGAGKGNFGVKPGLEGDIITVVMPAKAGIQYSVRPELNISGAEYWIIRFRG